MKRRKLSTQTTKITAWAKPGAHAVKSRDGEKNDGGDSVLDIDETCERNLQSECAKKGGECSEINLQETESDGKSQKGTEGKGNKFVKVNCDNIEKNFKDDDEKRQEKEQSECDKKQKAATERHFQRRWLNLFPWLRYNEKENTMWCSTCREMGKKNTLALGVGKNFRTSTLSRHSTHREHQLAIKAPLEQANFKTATKKALTKEEAGIQVAMKVVFWMAQECLPLSKYGSLMSLLKMLEVPNIEYLKINDRTSYTSYTTAVDLLDVLSTVIDDNITRQIKESPVLTILCDESTDILVHHKLVINCRVVDPLSLAPKTFFLTDLRIQDGTGRGIFKAIQSHLETRGVTVKEVTSLGTDGASVMTGQKEGLMGQFLKENPHISNSHCSAHRLALCTEQAATGIQAIGDFSKHISQIYYHFKRSPHKVDMMEYVQKVVEGPVLKYREVHQIRWLSFMEALDAVVRTLDALLTYFSSTAELDPQSVGLGRKVSSEMFILLAHGMLDILRPVIALSLTFQKKDLDIGCVKVDVETCLKSLHLLKEEENPMEKPRHLAVAQDNLKEIDGQLTYKGHHVSKMTSRTQFRRAYNKYIEAIIANLEKRFPDTELMAAFGVLALRPISFLKEEEVDSWGDSSMNVLLEHFGKEQQHMYKERNTKVVHYSKSEAMVDRETAMLEWKKLKHIVRTQQYPHHSMASLWGIVMKFHREEFPNLVVLAALALAHAVHTADCERSFSSQNQVTCPLRNRLSAEHCDQLMRVMIEGGDITNFSFSEALLKWRNVKDRVIFRK